MPYNSGINGSKQWNRDVTYYIWNSKCEYSFIQNLWLFLSLNNTLLFEEGILNYCSSVAQTFGMVASIEVPMYF
jgi:hypothetical protein